MNMEPTQELMGKGNEGGMVTTEGLKWKTKRTALRSKLGLWAVGITILSGVITAIVCMQPWGEYDHA